MTVWRNKPILKDISKNKGMILKGRFRCPQKAASPEQTHCVFRQNKATASHRRRPPKHLRDASAAPKSHSVTRLTQSNYGDLRHLAAGQACGEPKNS